MKVLFVSLDLPFPTDRGQRMRNWSILRALAAEHHEVSLITFCEDHGPAADSPILREVCGAVQVVPSAFRSASVWNRLRALASPTPYGAWRFRSETLLRRVRHHLAGNACDVVIWDEVYNLENLREQLPVPVVLNSHDIMQVIWGRYLSLERNPLNRLYARIEYSKLRRWEPTAHRRVDRVLAVSVHDACLLRELCPGLRVSVVPNTVDPDAYTPSTDDDGSSALFVGGMDWFPNLDAVEFFISAVLPEMRRLLPAARFVVAGRAPSPAARARLERPGVQFLGRVPDMRPVINDAALCVVPLRIGSGVRWKILEAAAMGKAVVSTRLGAEGLDFVDGKEIILADEPMALARAVCDLLADQAIRRDIGQAARRRVEDDYSFTVLRHSLREALADFEPRAASTRTSPPTVRP